MRLFLIWTGAVMALYGLGVLAVIGTGHWFSFFYLVFGLLVALCGRNLERMLSMDRRLLTAAGALICVLLVLFVLFEAAAVSAALKGPEAGGDYIVLLGCQVRQEGPSRDMYSRVKAAAAYLKDNPNCRAVVTGGQGSNEPMTEAEAEKRELVRLGIDEDRIIIEDRSTSTRENLLFARELIEKDGGDPAGDSVVIVSADYHLFRASFTAKKLGYGSVSCSGGRGLLYLLPHYYTREFAAFIKELFSF